MPAVKLKEGESPLLKILFTSSIILPALLLRKDNLIFLMFWGEGKTRISGDMTARTEDNSKNFLRLTCVIMALLQFAVLDSLVFQSVKISFRDVRILTDP